jgi:predicted porin
MEAGVAMDDGSTFSMNRNTYAGLSSKTAGTVLMGRHDTPYKLATRGLDQFADTLGDTRSIMGGGYAATVTANTATGLGTYGGANTAVMNFDGRQSNVLAYISPTINGMHAAIAHVDAGEKPTASGQSKASAWSMVGIYDLGGLFASLAYEKHNLNATATGTTPDVSEKAWKLGVGYTTGAFNVAAAYEKTSDDLGNITGMCTAGGSSCANHKAYQLGAGYTFGNNKVKLQYVKADKTDDASRAGTDDSAKQWSLGFDHNMSKRTRLYAVYTKMDNATNGSYNLYNGGNNAFGSVMSTDGADQSAWSFGMKHSF